MPHRVLALGFSGGGDSTALLHALRAAFPDAELHAFVVDHGLRADSAAEANQAAAAARQAGAQAQILRWRTPRPSQAAARRARHVLLARAAQAVGAEILCLGHTLDDRIETVRMRQARTGPDHRLAGPGWLDPSPVWPEGAGLTIARPLLAVRRGDLRAYLECLGVSWIEDPSNVDQAYERVRVRRSKLTANAEADLLRRSDAARRRGEDLRAAAADLIARAVSWTDWGGARLDVSAIRAAEPAVVERALDALVLAVSGHDRPPEPAALVRLRAALTGGEAATLAGAHLTADGVMGRDAGAAGRCNGAPAAAPILVRAGEACVFDGRWAVRASHRLRVGFFGERSAIAGADIAPSLRPGLAALFDPESGERLAVLGVHAICSEDATLLCPKRIEARLLPRRAPTWFDAKKPAAVIDAVLAKGAGKANITLGRDNPVTVQAALDVSRGEEENR